MADTARAGMHGTFAFDVADVSAALGRQVMARALRMVGAHSVRDLVISADGTRLTATVPSEQSTGRDPRGQSYSASIILTRVGGKLRVKGYCSCPMGLNCKHVGVALLTCLARRQPAARGMPAGQREDDAPQADDDAMAPVATGSETHPVATSSLTQVEASSLDATVRGWLDRIAAAGMRGDAAPVRTTSRAPTRRLLYVLSPQRHLSYGGVAVVMPVSIGLASDGRPKAGDVRDLDVEEGARLKAQGVKYLSQVDFELLDDLATERHRQAGHGPVRLRASSICRDILERLAATGRLHWEAIDGPVLRLGPPVAAQPVWKLLADGKQRMMLEAGDGGVPFDAVLAVKPPFYVRAGLIGVVATHLAPDLAVEIAQAPSITRAETAVVRAALERHSTNAGPDLAEASKQALGDTTRNAAPFTVLPLPPVAASVTTRRVTPTVRLRLHMRAVRVHEPLNALGPDAQRGRAPTIPLAALAFDYDGEVVPFGDRRDALELQPSDNSTLTVIPRDIATEDAALQRLAAARFVHTRSTPFSVPDDPGNLFWSRPVGDLSARDTLQDLIGADRYIAFSAHDVPRLAKAGWRIEFERGYPYEVTTGEAAWWADAGDSAAIDWFSFELGITFEGQRVSVIPQLASLIAKLPASLIDLAAKPGGAKQFGMELAGYQLYLNLPDGRLLKISAERMAPILRGLLELIGPRENRIVDGKVKLHRGEVSALTSFADLTKVAWAASAARLLDLGRALSAGRTPAAVTPPPEFTATLRPYQADGLAWLAFLREAGFGGVLADDMGLGKTIQGLAFLACEKAAGRLTKPALIVAPTSVLPNWEAEAVRFAPHLHVVAPRGMDRKARLTELPTADIALTTYPLLARDQEALLEQEFHAVILDEAQAIKNPQAAVTKIAHRLRARHRFALTGTPLENNLGEVWSLFEFLSPGLLGDDKSFRRTFRTPIEKHGDPRAQAFLSQRVKPFMLRRTKSEVAKELPAKTEIVERIELEGDQRDLYESVRALMERRVREEIDKKGLAQSHIVFLDALLKLRQICCDPRLLKMDAARSVKQSAKLERLMELLPEMVAEGRRVLLFSQFTSMLDLIELELRRERIGYVTLRGDTLDRAAPVRAFQAGEAPVFLLSLKAGGTGLNLTAADTVIHYDPWWNPAVEAQATDRAYRIGQDKPVFVHKLIVQDGIEDAIERLKAKKAALAAALFEGGTGAPLKLSEADIAALFAPIGRTAPQPTRRR